jgi:chloramphenicol-sensitive protein RarD
MNAPTETEIRRASFAALGAYLIWGVSPLYFRLLDFSSALEIVLHRVVWATPLLLGLIWVAGKRREILPVLADRRTLLTLLATSALIAVNWWTFVWSVNNGALLQASLGYYLNPLMSVALGVVILREPLGPRRIIAIGLAAAGVLNQIIAVGELPWVTLVLAFSFTAYGYLRKTAAVDGRIGLFWETVFVMPFALVGLVWMEASGIGQAFAAPWNAVLLAIAGMVTVVPLMLYVIGARGLRLSTMGVLQFIAPSLQFLLGIAFGEPFTLSTVVTFGFIWAGVAVFIWSQVAKAPDAPREGSA